MIQFLPVEVTVDETEAEIRAAMGEILARIYVANPLVDEKQRPAVRWSRLRTIQKRRDHFLGWLMLDTPGFPSGATGKTQIDRWLAINKPSAELIHSTVKILWSRYG